MIFTLINLSLAQIDCSIVPLSISDAAKRGDDCAEESGGFIHLHLDGGNAESNGPRTRKN